MDGTRTVIVFDFCVWPLHVGDDKIGNPLSARGQGRTLVDRIVNDLSKRVSSLFSQDNKRVDSNLRVRVPPTQLVL